jgi:hypothetical protein
VVGAEVANVVAAAAAVVVVGAPVVALDEPPQAARPITSSANQMGLFKVAQITT